MLYRDPLSFDAVWVELFLYNLLGMEIQQCLSESREKYVYSLELLRINRWVINPV